MAKNQRQVITEFESKPEKIRSYFQHLVDLIEKYPWDISLGYVFSKIEDAKRVSLYFGIVRLHNANATVTRDWVRDHYLNRDHFLKLFCTIYGKPIPDSTLSLLERTENIRDKVAHAQNWSDSDARHAIVDALKFAESFNDLIRNLGVTEPFNGDKRGWRGAATGLPVDTSLWILRGIAAAASEVKLPKQKAATKPV
jgi:hypothetical protein